MMCTTNSNIFIYYPTEVQKQLKDLTNLVVDSLDPTAIYLLGSTARGELSWMRHPSGRIELFSDYEFAVITHRKPGKGKLNTLQRQVHAQEREIANPNPLFHIDFIIREQQRLTSMARIIFTFEFKKNGLLLYGKELRNRIPEVTLDNLNTRNANEILCQRLWAILLYLPEPFIYKKLNPRIQRVAGYNFCRNALDLTTVFLPSKGYLLPTYRQRVSALTEHNADFVKYFGSDFSAFMQLCLDRRLDLDFSSIDLHALYSKTINFLEQGLLLLLQSTNIHTLPQHSPRIFNELPISRGEWYNLLRLTYNKIRHHGLRNTFHWLRLPVKGWLALGLLMMHKSLIYWMDNRKQVAEEHLEYAKQALQTITSIPYPTQTVDFPRRWLALRRSWGNVWLQTIQMGTKTAEEQIKSRMEWNYE